MAGLIEYKCPCCGGSIKFDSGTQQMKCPYCETSFDVETLKEYDAQLNNQPEPEIEWDISGGSEWQEGEADNMVTYLCDSCGGEIVCDKNTAASSCPYCGSPVVMAKQFKGLLRPDYIIPFKLDKEAAKKALTNHLKGKRLLPKLFKDKNRIEEIKGIYVPFWLFDCDVDASIKYNATRNRFWSDSKYNYSETTYFMLVREGKIGFCKVPVDGASKIPDDMMEAIEPFDYSEAVDFQTAYLSGFFADKFDVDAHSSISRANERVKNSTVAEFANTTIGYTTCVPTDKRIRLEHGEIGYALLPVWLLNTKYNNKIYTFAMNGQTGKFIGDLPMDKGAFWRWFVGLFAGITAVLSAVFLLLI